MKAAKHSNTFLSTMNWSKSCCIIAAKYSLPFTLCTVPVERRQQNQGKLLVFHWVFKEEKEGWRRVHNSYC